MYLNATPTASISTDIEAAQFLYLPFQHRFHSTHRCSRSRNAWAAHLRHLVRSVVRLGALQQLGCQVAVFPVKFLQKKRGRVKIYMHNLAFRRCNTFWDKNQYSLPIFVKFWWNFWLKQLDSNVILLQCWCENKSKTHFASLLCKMELLNRERS